MSRSVRTLRDVRLKAGIGLRELEQRTGINRAIISQVERGRLITKPADLQPIADVLGVTEIEFRTLAVCEVDE